MYKYVYSFVLYIHVYIHCSNLGRCVNWYNVTLTTDQANSTLWPREGTHTRPTGFSVPVNNRPHIEALMAYPGVPSLVVRWSTSNEIPMAREQGRTSGYWWEPFGRGLKLALKSVKIRYGRGATMLK